MDQRGIFLPGSTTKEIAQSMGISFRGVETSRYRLRKKTEYCRRNTAL